MINGSSARKLRGPTKKGSSAGGKRRKSANQADERVLPGISSTHLVSLVLTFAAVIGFVLITLRLQHLTPDLDSSRPEATRNSFSRVLQQLRGAKGSPGGMPPEFYTHQLPPGLLNVASAEAKSIQETVDLVTKEAAELVAYQDATPAPAPAEPGSDCAWEKHPGRYLGELVHADSRTMNAETAKFSCFRAGASCLGITCTEDEKSCTPRRGEPYLAYSAEREVSYAKNCPGTRNAPGNRVRLPQDQRPQESLAQLPKAETTELKPSPPTSSLEPLDMGGLGHQLLSPERLAIVVIAHNRPDCLEKCLESISNQAEARKVQTVVSLDDPQSYPQMEGIVNRYVGSLPGIQIWRKTPWSVARGPLKPTQAVSKISEHFRFAISEAFERKGLEYAIFLENDLSVAQDFLFYFRATAWLLEEDKSLFCVSAWNDNGFPEISWDEQRLFRTDYFPGLGWMIRNRTWLELREDWPRFPSTGWDHWIRHGSAMPPRECVVPEVSRTHHFDNKGTNIKAGSPLATKLSRMRTSNLQPGQLGDLSYLLQDRYEAQLRTLLARAQLIKLEGLKNLDSKKVYLLPYLRSEYKSRLSKPLQITEAQPRTAHGGLIITREPASKATVILADRMRSGEALPLTERILPHPGQQVLKANPGESCRDACTRMHLYCRDSELEFINNCAALKQYFPCEEGCGHQVGQEIPCYVHDFRRDTAKQCLVTDDAIPSCMASCAATTRLCACVPS